MSNSVKEKGRLSFEWARAHMPAYVLAEKYVRNEIKRKGRNPFSSVRIAACLHVSKETSVLVQSLYSLGARVHLVAANPLSSQPDIIAFLTDTGIEVSAQRGETAEEYENQIVQAAKREPNLIIDDGAELHVAYSRTGVKSCFGGTDETTSGTTRLRALDRKGKLRYPVIAVNEANTKHIFDNLYGTGQSAIDGLIRATGLLLAGKIVVVAGYGWVGRGVALRARGLGARVIVTEVNPIRALEAHLDGYEVKRMKEAAREGEVFLTCTGQTDVLSSAHFEAMKDGAILGNVGHFDREIDVRSLLRLGERVEQTRDSVAKVEMRPSEGKKSLFLLCQGRVVNLAAAEGHPPEVMQLSFANQLLSLYHLALHQQEFRKSKPKVLSVPREIDELVARLALRAFNLTLDTLSPRQERYARSF